MTLYFFVKFIHVFFVMMWAMSAVGAYVFYLRATVYDLRDNPGDPKLQERLVWAYEQFDKTVILEHIAFPIVLVTGATMFVLGGWTLASHWLAVKLAIVVFIFIPMELLDIWISHVLGPRISRRRKTAPNEWDEGRALHLKFLQWMSPTVRITVPAVLLLAVAKPMIW